MFSLALHIEAGNKGVKGVRIRAVFLGLRPSGREIRICKAFDNCAAHSVLRDRRVFVPLVHHISPDMSAALNQVLLAALRHPLSVLNSSLNHTMFKLRIHFLSDRNKAFVHFFDLGRAVALNGGALYGYRAGIAGLL